MPPPPPPPPPSKQPAPSAAGQAETFFVGQEVYANVKNKGWARAKVVAVAPDGRFEIAGPEVEPKTLVPPTALHGYVPGGYDLNESDLFRLNDLHVATLLANIKARYEQENSQQYARMGDMILSVNPFQRLGLNSLEARDDYLKAQDASQLPPHVWQIADRAYRRIVASRLGNQSIVISGESGSGKTENTKAMIGYLGALSLKHSCNALQRSIVERVNERLAQSNPILESFGNARTVRNDNSSRFGKYVKLYFDPESGIMIGAAMDTYLLEKSRIVRLGAGERGYHVFYEMLAGLPADVKQSLGGLKSAADYPCLSRGNTLRRRGIDGRELDDAAEFKNLVNGLNAMGIDATVQHAIWTTLAAILHLQEVKFGKDQFDKAMVATEEPLAVACKLLGISHEALKPCFLVKSKTKILTTMSTQIEAEGLRDSFCKALYVGIFDWLVAVVNRAIAPTTSIASAKYIGILDIFGFENFEVNSFEQLCINFANESLANHYNKYTFVGDKEECAAEGIEFPPVQFPDNTACLAMFDQAKTGIFALLDEACYFKGGTHETFTGNVWEQWTGKSEYFIRPKSTAPVSFGVKHYACDVVYSTPEWLEKNSDPLKEETRDVLRTSAVGGGFVAALLDAADVSPSDGQTRKRTSVSTRFRTQLVALRAELESTETHFVRCVKPNMRAVPRSLDNEHVCMQLESAGVLQTIALKRQGYPSRRELGAFAKFFHSLAPSRVVIPLIKANKYAEASRAILELYIKVFGWKPPHYAVGRTKVFMKSHIWGALEKTLLRRNKMRLRRVVPLLKKWIARYRQRKEEEAARKRQAAVAQQRSTVDIGGNKFEWFEELCRVFPKFDPTIVYDVVGNLPTKQQAARALSEMRAAELHSHVPSHMHALLTRAGLTEAGLRTLLSNGIDTLEKVYQLTPEVMTSMGLSASDQKYVGEVIIQQSGADLRNKCMLESGTGELPPISDAQLAKLAEMERQARTLRDKLNELAMVTGTTVEQAARALAQAQGNESVAASILLDVASGRAPAPPPRAPTSTATAPPPAAQPLQAVPASVAASPSSTNRPPPPTSRPRCPPEMEANVNRLVNEMGFDSAAAIDALRRSNNDFRAAVNSLLGA